MLEVLSAWGPLLQTVVVVGSVIGFVYSMKSEILSIRTDLSNLKDAQRTLNEAFTQLGRILTQVAVQDSRLNMFEKRLDELVHEQDFVRQRKTRED